MVPKTNKVALAKLKELDHKQGAKVLEENGYQLIGQHAYPRQQQSADLKIFYYSEHQYQAWDNQANPMDHKLHTAVYENIDDYVSRKKPVSEAWSNLTN